MNPGTRLGQIFTPGGQENTISGLESSSSLPPDPSPIPVLWSIYIFETKGETEEAVLDSVMHHIHAEHLEELEDWFGIEDIYQAARKAIYKRAE